MSRRFVGLADLVWWFSCSRNKPRYFVVEGEKRYWLHVAIDRFTGEVIDQQLETVYE